MRFRPRPPPLALLVLAVWTLVGVLAAGQLYLIVRNEGVDLSFLRALGIQVPPWLLWAAATPLVLRLKQVAPIERGNLAVPVAVHLGAALAISSVRSLALGGLNLALFPASGPQHFGTVFLGQFYSRAVFDVLTYAGVLGIAYAVEFRDRFRARTQDAARLEGLLAQAELQALKMQLHPHFLFNTLNAIGVLAEENPAAAKEMITLLGDLLRATLDQAGAQEVHLRQELELLTSYLEIERLRFPDRLSVSVVVPPDLLDAWVPNLVLQPLVENAVRYAIAPRSAPGAIAVRATRVDDRLELSVEDDGPGIPDAASLARKPGLGLSTTRARLERLYGSDGRLDLSRGRPIGTVVTVTIPYRAGAAPA